MKTKLPCEFMEECEVPSVWNRLFHNYTATKYSCKLTTDNCVGTKEQLIGSGTLDEETINRCPVYMAQREFPEAQSIGEALDKFVRRYSLAEELKPATQPVTDNQMPNKSFQELYHEMGLESLAAEKDIDNNKHSAAA